MNRNTRIGFLIILIAAAFATLFFVILPAAGLMIFTTDDGTVTEGPLATTPEPDNVFSARRESSDGAIVAWDGYSGGYQPGMEAQFGIEIRNETGQNWRGRYCLQLLDRRLPRVIATLEQRMFTLEPGVGFSDTLTIRFPDVLDEGAYGLSLAVRRPAGSMVDLVPIQVGTTDEARRATTQQDLDAALEACPPVAEAGTDPEQAVAAATADLAQRLGISPAQIRLQAVGEAMFPDASLGVPEPGKTYAQVVTPGYVIELAAEGQVYMYHGSAERVVLAPQGGGASQGSITVESVRVDAGQILVAGRSSLPDGTCLGSELWADGELQAWWPGDACVTVENGAWQMAVRLGSGGIPADLDRSAQYMLRVFQQGGPNIVSVFAFDLAALPTPGP